MATRCNIIAHLSDGTFRSIYVHFDGYPEGVGKTLLEHYNTQADAEKVTSLGALSILAQSCECPPGHTFKTPVGGFSVAYHRDRQEPFEDTRAGLGATPVQALDDNPVQGRSTNTCGWTGVGTCCTPTTAAPRSPTCSTKLELLSKGVYI